MKTYDAIIIGAGQAGVPLAKKIAAKGLTVAIVESKIIGGTCINYGCTPTKTMVASAKTMYTVNTAAEVGVVVQQADLDFKAVIDRKNKIVEKSQTGAEKGLRTTENVTVIMGEASFNSNNEIKIALKDGGEDNISAENIFINTGARPTIPKIEGLNTIPFLNSTTIMELSEVPEHLLIVGASYIALEFGQMFKRFGSKVTILEQAEEFLSREDADVSKEIKQFLENEQLTIYTSASVQQFSLKEKTITASVKIGNNLQAITCSHVLIATGRTPNTNMLHLENTNIKTEKGFIQVDDKLQTNAANVYALGDVKGGPAFTHISYNDYLIVCGNIYGGENQTITNRMVPYCMFTDPQFGKVGLSEKEAKAKGIDFKVASLAMAHVARGIETNETIGFMKALVDPATKEILGAAVIGAQGGEIMSMLQIAMMGKVTYDVLRCAVFAHPLYVEALNNLFLSFDEGK